MNLSLLTVLCHGKNNSQLKELLKNNKILNFINTFIKDKPYYETPFRFLKLLSKNATLPACIICGNIISYSIWNRRNNAKFCSKTCKYSKEGKENTRKNIEKTLIEKYKVKNILQHKKFKEKQELTCLAKYGTKFYSKTSECKEKVKKTSLEKFGTNNVMFNKKVLKNIKNNNLLKFGVEWPLSDKTIHKKTMNSLVKKHLEKLKKFNLTLLDEYQSTKEYYNFKCATCGNTFKDHLKNGRIPICKHCFPSNTSIGEKELSNFIKQFSSNISLNDRTLINPLELDIVIPEKHLAIEFNGLYWHSEEHGKNENYHINKSLLCKSKNFNLIHIFEDEWLFQKNIIKGSIKEYFNSKKIKTNFITFKKIDNKLAKKFNEKYNILGHITTKNNFGLFYKNRLIHVLSVGKPRFNKIYKYEIYRLSSTFNFKIENYFKVLIDNLPLSIKESLIFYENKRFPIINKTLLDNLIFLSNSKPSYFFVKNKNRYSKYNKINRFDYKIWDCGSTLYQVKY